MDEVEDIYLFILHCCHELEWQEQYQNRNDLSIFISEISREVRCPFPNALRKENKRPLGYSPPPPHHWNAVTHDLYNK